MSESESGQVQRAPWHLWVVGIIALLWNAMGAFDYVMTETRNEWYMSQFTPEQLEYYSSFPAWVVALWAIAVWGGLLASLLLLFRKRSAATLYLVSFFAMVVTTVYNFVLSSTDIASDTASLVFSAVIFVMALLLLLYARAMRRRGILV